MRALNFLRGPMFKKLAIAAAGLMAAGTSLAQMPSPSFPVFKTATEIEQACNTGLGRAAERLKAMEKRKVDAGWINAYDQFYAANEDDAAAIDFLQYVAPEGSLRDAAQACSLRWSEFNSSLNQDAALYKAMKVAPAQDGIDRELKRVNVAQFEAGGVSLPPAQRARAKAILDKLAALEQAYNKNIRDAGIKLRFTEAELKGVPESVWKNAPRDADGRVVLGISNPVLGPVLQSADSAAARERMWRAKANEGGPANIKLMGQAGQLRHELAGLFGYDNYVDFKLHNKMAHDAKTAWQFLDEVKSTVSASDRTDYEALRAAKAQDLGQPPEGTVLKAWDASYYAERLRRARYSVDQEAFRPYFPPEQSLRFVMHVVEKMMGVRYRQVEVPLWAPGVEAFVVTDVATGQDISQLYVDLYPREGKYNHAAVWPLRSGSTEQGRHPVAALVVNFDSKGLTLSEMEVLLHEFGHSVHVDLSNTRHALQSGTSVVQDFVEAPSQMLEDWVYDKKVLKLMADVCPDCKPVPDELVDKAVAARDFGKGSRFARQHLYASYDLSLNAKDTPAPLPQWAAMEAATPLGYEKGSLFPAHFAHLMSDGYGAGYYGYLWSLVIAMDLRTAFAHDKLDPVTGMNYRNKVLAQGSQQPASELVNDFLGRKWNSGAFFADLKR
jgi:thimet oligopeptidase